MITFAAMRFYFRFALVLVLGLLLSTCKKDHRLLDASVQPEDDLLTAHFDESALLYGYAQNNIPVNTLNDRYKFLGNSRDPIFGQIDVGLYLNINTTKSNLTFTGTPILDSAVFVFSVDPNNFTGSFVSPLTFSVFTLDSSLNKSRNYITNTKGLHNPVPLGASQTTMIRGSNGTFTIRIKLDQDYAKKFISRPDSLTSNEKMQEYYKGFYFAASVPTGYTGVVMRCDLEDAASGLFFYTKENDTSSVNVYEKFNFSGYSAVRFNTVNQDLASANSILKTQSPADSASTPYFFVKGLGVTNTKILIPKLTSYADSAEFAVNRAEITFNIDESLGAIPFTEAPIALCLLPLTPAGRDTFSIDQLTTIDNARYGGIYSAGKYTFNITRHVQAIVAGQVKNNGFVLVVANPERIDVLNNNGILTRIIRRDYYSEGVVLSGPASPENAPRLKISFVRLNSK